MGWVEVDPRSRACLDREKQGAAVGVGFKGTVILLDLNLWGGWGLSFTS